MQNDSGDVAVLPTDLEQDAIAQATAWAQRGALDKQSRSAELLARLLKDQNGLAFTVGFVDRVVRPEDLRVAARSLSGLARQTPTFLPAPMKLAIRVGGALAPILPWPIVPIARKVLRSMVGHLVIDARPARLGKAIAKLKRHDVRLNLNLLGEAVLGDAEAQRRLAGTKALLARDDVDYVSIKVSSVVSQLSMWAFDETVDRIVERLTPLYELAAASGTSPRGASASSGAAVGSGPVAASRPRKFINLDMEEYRDLDLTIAVFEKLLDQPQLRELEAGIVLQAYLPDALRALRGLTEWATARVASGGAPIKVRVVKGANLAMEHVDAAVHGWPLATYAAKQDTDTNYKRLLNWAMTKEHTAAVRLGVAGHNLFDIAFAHLLATRRGVQRDVEFEMLLGMAEGQAAEVRKDVGGLLLYTPVVQPKEFDVAISYLVRRLEENASQENFMSAVFEIAHDSAFMSRERDRFLAAANAMTDDVPESNRQQSRLRSPQSDPAPVRGFANASDTDPALSQNRLWGRAALEAATSTALGRELIADAAIEDAAALEDAIARAAASADGWAARGGAGRGAILARAAEELEAARGDLITVMAAETGKTIAEGDPEVTEAVDFARYYGSRAAELDAIPGTRFTPSRLTVVTPPWNFPVAIPAGSTLAALAAGSPVILKPAKLAQRSGAVMAAALWRAGVPRDVLQLVDLKQRDLGQKLISDLRVERVILTGGYETAQMFRSWRPDLPLLAETSGKNAMIVTPSADIDLAVADLVKSAFGHAGQKCSAASLVILVGSVGRSQRFERQLLDSVRSLRVGYPTDPSTQMGPIIEPANGKLKDALTTLGPGERWLLQPRALDDTGRLWSPGIRTGVQEGSYFHLTEFFGPVLGVMHAATIEDAIRLQNASPYGLTAGLHSLDPDELRTWLAGVQAGNLYVNRGTTGAIVRRQPFGGWKRSSVGAGTKAGGPNYLIHLGSWQPSTQQASTQQASTQQASTERASTQQASTEQASTEQASTEQASTEQAAAVGVPAGSSGTTRLSAEIEHLLGAADLSAEEAARVRAAAEDDESQWQREFGATTDVSALGLERNLFRYRPIEVTIRLSEGAPRAELVRIVAAGIRAGAPIQISTATEPPSPLLAALHSVATAVVVESDADWCTRARSTTASRIRLIGGDAAALSRALDGSPDIAVYGDPVTSAGRIELLPFLREQAISITAHRFGNPDDWSAAVI
ncbi:MAG: bifunctional proline dehydrogenase/L-glutamate gamma-semialdehyde dehydrogenase [Microbacteriaceae bacterium]